MLKFKLKRCFDSGFQFHQFRSLTLYSTVSPTTSNDVSTNPLMLQFLVNSVGFAEDEAVSIVTNCKVSHRFKSTPKSQLVVDFLKRSGFDDTHIRKLVTAYPMVLRSDVDKTLEPKIRVLQDLGFTGSDLVQIISRHPLVLKRSLNAHIVPTLETLKSFIGGSNEQLVSLMLKPISQTLLSRSTLKNLPHNVLLLQSYGVPMGKLKWLMLHNPLILLGKAEWIRKVVKGVDEKLGIPPTSAVFLHGVSALSQKSDENFEKWRQVFRSYGWSETDISKLLRKFPQCLSLSENVLRVKLKYLMEDLGYGCDFLVARPALLSYSVEKRIVPRTAVMQALKANKLLKNDACFYAFVAMAESKFMEKHMLPARDKLPQLYEYYIQTRDGSPAKT